MRKNTKKIIISIAVAVVFAESIGSIASAQPATNVYQKKFKPGPQPKIVKQPESQLVQLGQSATFTVQAKPKSVSYQWVFKCNLIPGATNSTLLVDIVNTNKVGFYSCAVHSDTVLVLTRPAPLMAYSTNDDATITVWSTPPPGVLDGDVERCDGTITVWSTPPPGGSGSGSGCPYPYVGYVNFSTGWAPKTWPSHSAQDTTRSDTKIKFFGSTFGNNGCGTGGFVNVSPLNSAIYRFTVYFPTAPVPTDPYPLVLTGF